MDWQYTNDRTVQLQWGFPHSSRCRFLAVLPAHVQTMPSGGATRTGSDAATCVLPMLPACLLALSSKFFETMLSTPTWISFWRCNSHAPGGATSTRHPFPCSSGSAPRTCPGRCLACVQRCLAGKRFSPVLALLLAGALTVSHTRHDVASPASVSVHSIASIVEPGLGGGPTLALLRTLSQAEFTSPSPSWRLMEDRSCSLSFLTQHRCCNLHCLPFSVS